MATEVVMPQLGSDMQDGTLVRWLKTEGDQVSRGEALAEIETDKAVVEMEAFASGVLRKVLVGEGAKVPVGQVIGFIGSPDEPLPEVVARPGTAAPVQEAPPQPAPEAVVPRGEVAEAAALPGGLKASPLARRLAQEKGIDLTQVVGTGPGGRITKEDILAYETKVAEAPVPSPTLAPALEALPDIIPLSRMRQVIAKTTTQSKGEVPHFYVAVDIDMTRAMELRQQLNELMEEGVRVSVNDLIVKACAKAIPKYPAYNSFFQGDHLKVNKTINIGIAVTLEQGLILPAIPHCESKSIAEIAKASKDLVERAQKGVLSAEEYTAGTFSVSNLGMFDVDSFVAIIYPPQSAILAVGSVRQQPVVRESQVVIRQVMKATISVDHRVSDGAEAAQFLGEVKSLLEKPVLLVM